MMKSRSFSFSCDVGRAYAGRGENNQNVSQTNGERKEKNTEKKINPKREARKAAKEKRDSQPASEKYAKDKANAKGKADGPDARRKAHDEKDEGAPDRTKKQIDEDYKIKKSEL